MKRLLTIIPMLLLAVYAMADNCNKFDPNEHKRMLHQYVVSEAKLNATEASQFFSIYDKMRQQEQQYYEVIRKVRAQKPKTDQECANALKTIDETLMKMKQAVTNAHKQMLKRLPASKVYAALDAADRFDRIVFKEISKKQVAPKPAPKFPPKPCK